MSNYYEDYYTQQIGGTLSNYPGAIKKFYIGSPYQRGHGIGSFLGGLFRRILPFLSRGARVVGKEVLKSGINFLDDISHTDVSPKEAFKYRMRETGQNLKRKAEEKLDSMMQGSGYYKYRKIRKINQSDPIHAIGTIVKRKVKKQSKNKKKKTKKKNKTKKTRKRSVKKVLNKKKKSNFRSVRDIFA